MKTLILICMLALFSSLATADGFPGKNGYVTDRYGDIVRDNYGACWHSRSWTPAMAVPECAASAMKKNHARSTSYSGPNSWKKSTND
jgi:hypothetical protein